MPTSSFKIFLLQLISVVNVQAQLPTDRLVGFWPFTNSSQELTKRLTNIGGSAVILRNETGPFRVFGTSASRDVAADKVFGATNVDVTGEWTLTFFYKKSTSTSTSGLFTLPAGFGISANDKNLKFSQYAVKPKLNPLAKDEYEWKQYTTADLALSDDWELYYFVKEDPPAITLLTPAIVHFGTSKDLRGGLLQALASLSLQVPFTPAPPLKLLDIGSNVIDGPMSVTGRLACVSLYSKVLDNNEIWDVYNFCNATSTQLTTTTPSPPTAPTSIVTTDEVEATNSQSSPVITQESTSAGITETAKLSTISSKVVQEPGSMGMTQWEWESIQNIPSEKVHAITIETVMAICEDFSPKRSVPPNNNQPTHVDLLFQVNSLNSLSNVDQAITVDGLVMLHWNVTTCKLNESTIFSSIKQESLFVASTTAVWTPKFRFKSSADSNLYMKGDKYGEDITVVLTNNGHNQVLDFYYLLEGYFSSSCSLVLWQFPYDEQTCKFSFELIRPTSVLRLSDQMHFNWAESFETDEWTFKGYSIERSEEQFLGKDVHGADFTVTLRRKPDYYVINLALPSFLLTTINLVTFVLPPETAERPTFTVTSLLALMVTQADVRNQLPKQSDPILLGDYIASLTGFAACLTVYQLLTLFYCNNLGGDKLKLIGARWRIRRARLLDLVVFAIALVVFIAIHAYAMTISKL